MARYTVTVQWYQLYAGKKSTEPRTLESFQRNSPQDYKKLLEQSYADIALELIETTDSPYEKICCASKIIHEVPGALERMRTAPRENLTSFINRLSSDRFDNWALHLYLKARDLVGIDKLIIRTLHYGDFKKIEESVRATGLDFEPAGEGFEHYTLNLCEAQRKGMIHLVSLYFLRCHYGQEVVVEMLSKFEEAKVNWAAFDYVEMLANWNALRENIPQWISATVESQDIFDSKLSVN